MKKFLILVSAGLMLAGCAGTPKKKKIMNVILLKSIVILIYRNKVLY